jgi:hypothetical protein
MITMTSSTNNQKKKIIQPSKSPNKDSALGPTEANPFVIRMDRPRSLHDPDEFNPLYSAPYSREFPDPDILKMQNQGKTIISSESRLLTPDGYYVKETMHPDEIRKNEFSYRLHNRNNGSPINADDDMEHGLYV